MFKRIISMPTKGDSKTTPVVKVYRKKITTMKHNDELMYKAKKN